MHYSDIHYARDMAAQRVHTYQQEAEQGRISARCRQRAGHQHILGNIGRALIAYEQRVQRQRPLLPIVQGKRTGHLHA